MEPTWWRDWRVWVPTVGIVVVAVLDLVFPNATLFPYMVVPVVASAIAGRPWLTLGLTALALGLVEPLTAALGYSGPDLWSRVVLLALSGAVAAMLATFVGRTARARDDAVRRLAQSEERYRLLADNSADVVLQADADGRLVFVSPAVTSLLGYQPDELSGLSVRDLIHPEDVAASDAVLASVAQGRDLAIEARLRRKDGSYVWVGSTGGPITDTDGRVLGAVATWRNIDAQVEARMLLEHRARVDDLTGLLNRREGLSRIEHLGASDRRPGDRAAVLFIDLDGFKGVNDRLGHAAGDEVLRALTRRILDAIRGSDVAARMGGDEFAVLLDGLHDPSEAAQIAEKIRAAASRPVSTREGEVTVTLSIGVAVRSPQESVDELLTRADIAMYRAKAEGRNRVIVVADEEALH